MHIRLSDQCGTTIRPGSDSGSRDAPPIRKPYSLGWGAHRFRHLSSKRGRSQLYAINRHRDAMDRFNYPKEGGMKTLTQGLMAAIATAMAAVVQANGNEEDRTAQR